MVTAFELGYERLYQSLEVSVNETFHPMVLSILHR
jgi:hypothetical protein